MGYNRVAPSMLGEEAITITDPPATSGAIPLDPPATHSNSNTRSNAWSERSESANHHTNNNNNKAETENGNNNNNSKSNSKRTSLPKPSSAVADLLFSRGEMRNSSSSSSSPIEIPDASGIDPFSYNYRHWNSFYEIFKVVFFVVSGIFPLRVVLIIGLVLIAWVFASLSQLGFKSDGGRIPLSRARRNFLALPFKFVARSLLFVGGYYWIPVRGKRNAKEAPILVANHTHMLDPCYFFYDELVMVVAKAELGEIPVVRTILRALQTIFVHREDQHSRQNALNAILHRTAAANTTSSTEEASRGGEGKRIDQHQRFPSLLIFPEGTLTNGSCLLTFKPGAFTPGLPVQPVLLRYPFKYCDPSWVRGGPLAPAIAFRLLCQFVNHMSVTYLDVYYPSEAERKDPILYASNVRKLMAQHLNVPLADLSYAHFLPDFQPSTNSRNRSRNRNSSTTSADGSGENTDKPSREALEVEPPTMVVTVTDDQIQLQEV